MSLFPHYKSVPWDADSPHKPKQALCHKSRLLWFILAQNFLYKILEPSYTPNNNRQFLCSSWSSPFRISTFLLMHFCSFSISQFMVQRISAGRSHQSYGSVTQHRLQQGIPNEQGTLPVSPWSEFLAAPGIVHNNGVFPEGRSRCNGCV